MAYDAVPTCRTSGKRDKSADRFGAFRKTLKSDGFVLAKKTLKEDSVRRAALTDPIAIPPTIPTSNTTAR
jgi:hypothetical protein